MVPVTERELHTALQALKSQKAVGSDGLSNEMLHSFTDESAIGLQQWFNRILFQQEPWPLIWSLADVILLPKVALPRDYRHYSSFIQSPHEDHGRAPSS